MRQPSALSWLSRTSQECVCISVCICVCISVCITRRLQLQLMGALSSHLPSEVLGGAVGQKVTAELSPLMA